MRRALIAATVLVVFVCLAQGGIRADLSGDAAIDFQTTMDMPLMTVGNPGNAGELSGAGAGGDGPDRICGAVDYVYRMGKFEVTAGQYTEFLNAVAATDTYALYNTKMSSDAYGGCKIGRSGSAGSYTYSVAADRADRPVNWVRWGDAARFANWLTNGMPTGAQDATTTENGSYDLSGSQGYYGPDGQIPSYGSADWEALVHALLAVTRKSPEDGGRYYIPTEDEWYKAAYHANDGVTGNYFDYPTSSDAVPSNDLIDPDPGNSANFDQSGYTIGSRYWRTGVGEFENSESPYDTFDQGGNVMEWNEAIWSGSYRGVRGGSYYFNVNYLHASLRGYNYPTSVSVNFGFRVAEVPGPATMSLLAVGALAAMKRRKS